MLDYPIDDQLYQRLDSFYREHGRSDGVFVPYVGPDYARTRPRIMFVGKATNGWNHHRTLSAAKEHTEAFVGGRRFGTSTFWPFIVQATHLLCGGQPAAKIDREWALSRIVWSNLFKIDERGGNPSRSFVNLQAGLAREVLLRELTKLAPDIVVVATGNWENAFVISIFGEECEERRVDKHTIIRAGTVPAVIWTRHPQGWALTERTNMLGEAARLIAGVSNRSSG